MVPGRSGARTRARDGARTWRSRGRPSDTSLREEPAPTRHSQGKANHMSASRRTRWTLLVLLAAAIASAPLWHRLWDKQNHELRIWLGIYCFAMAGALTS